MALRRSPVAAAPSPARTGLLLALLTAAGFGTSGTFAAALTDAGWSPGAAVLARIGIAAVVLTVPGILSLRRHLAVVGPLSHRQVVRAVLTVSAFGLVAVAACQLAYFNAVQLLSVGVALMLEYLGIVLVVLWVWLRTRNRPRPLTLVGSGVAIAGLVFVLDLSGPQTLDPTGVLWGLGAAVGLALFYVVSADEADALPALVMAWAGTAVGALGLGAAALLGLLPLHATFASVVLGGITTSWVVPVLALALIATVLAYTTGVAAARLLGATLASFVGLTEVLFAVLFAWLVLGQLPTGRQLVGGLLILGGVAAVRVDELRHDRVPALPVEVPDAPFSALPEPSTPAGRT